MPVRTNVLERLYLLRMNRGPGPALDLFGAGSLNAAVLAADAGVFDALGATPRPVEAIADEVGADPAALTVLLQFLETVGYVTSSGDDWRATKMTRTWFHPDSDTDVTPWLRMWKDAIFPYWDAQFETALQEGEPTESLYDWLNDRPERWPLVQRGFDATARLALDPVLDLADVPDGAETLLDVGGGHGRYAIAFAEAFGLDAVVLDDEAALDVAAENVAEASMEDRIELRGGDYETDDLVGAAPDGVGEGYDVVLLFNVVHAHDDGEVQALFERVADALAPGGRLFVLDQFADSAATPVARTGVRFTALTYLTTLGGKVHDYGAVAGWLEAAGFRDVEKQTARSLPGTPLVAATKPT